MAQPTPGDVHYSRPLTGIAIANFQPERNYVTPTAAQIIPVQHKADQIYRFKKGEFHRDSMRERAPGTESVGGGWDLDTPLTYVCPVKSYHHDIDDQVRANTDTPLNQDRAASILVTQKGLLHNDNRFASLFMLSGAAWEKKAQGVANGAYSVGVNVVKWSDTTNSKPIAETRRWKRIVHINSGGFMPTRGVITRTVWDTLMDHPDITGRVIGGATVNQPTIINRAIVAGLLELSDILVLDAVINNAKEGEAWNPALIGGDAFLCYYQPPAPGVEVPAAIYGFAWVAYIGMAGIPTSGGGVRGAGVRVKKFRIEQISSDRVEIEMAFDWKMVGPDMAFLFYDLL